MLTEATRKWGLNREVPTALLRVRNGPECPEGYLRELTWDSNPNCRRASQSVSLVTQSCPNLCDPMNHSTRGLLVHHKLPEITQTHVHRVGGGMQTSHPLSSPSSPAPNPSQHQSLFQWVNSSHEVAKVLEVSASASVLPMNTQDFFLQDGLVGSPCSPKDSQESSPTP